MTDLENPNSVVQMKFWLSEQGLETDTLGKKAVAELIKDAPDDLAQVLSLRQQLAKSSVKKYQAMENEPLMIIVPEVCFSFMAPTVLVDGLAASSSYRTFHRIT